jgi:hypothetical protein
MHIFIDWLIDWLLFNVMEAVFKYIHDENSTE